jgi:hypothetical protein
MRVPVTGVPRERSSRAVGQARHLPEGDGHHRPHRPPRQAVGEEVAHQVDDAGDPHHLLQHRGDRQGVHLLQALEVAAQDEGGGDDEDEGHGRQQGVEGARVGEEAVGEEGGGEHQGDGEERPCGEDEGEGEAQDVLQGALG